MYRNSPSTTITSIGILNIPGMTTYRHDASKKRRDGEAGPNSKNQQSYKHLKACPRKSGDACLMEKSAKMRAHGARRTSVNQYTPTNHIINPCFPAKIPLDARK